jgi:hypothetical protein
MLEISMLLHGKLKEDENGRKVLVGGYTTFGAHSEVRLGGKALYHYQGMVVEKLYDGSCEWKAENSLAEQLKEIAESVIDDSVKEFRSHQKECERLGIDSRPVGLDVDWLGEEDGDLSTDSSTAVGMSNGAVEMTGELLGMTDGGLSTEVEMTDDVRHMKWEAICEAADGDSELEAFVQVTGESQSMKEVNERLGLKGDDRDRLMKRLKRKVGKKSYPKGKGRSRRKKSGK